MRYYKIIDGSKFIAVGATINLRRYQEKNNVVLACTEKTAQFIQIDNHDYYHDDSWMLSIRDVPFNITNAQIVEITEDEYNSLVEVRNVEMELPQQVEPEPTPEPEPLPDVEYAKDVIVKSLSNACNNTIICGFDIVLSDGDTHHFSLNIEDQIRIESLMNKINRGDTNGMLLHGDGEYEKEYSTKDVIAIYDKMVWFKNYNIVYFNNLKKYVKSLTDIGEISGIKYGDEIPTPYQTAIYKQMLLMK